LYKIALLIKVADITQVNIYCCQYESVAKFKVLVTLVKGFKFQQTQLSKLFYDIAGVLVEQITAYK
jgi:phage terminase small subunit